MAYHVATVSLLLALSGASCARGKKMNWWGETETRCMGRFCLEVPKSMSGRGIYAAWGIYLEEVHWSEPREGAFQRVWKQDVGAIEQLSKRHQLPDDATGTVLERRTFKPDVLNGIYYNPEESATLGAWTALLDAGLAGLRLKRRDPIESRSAIASNITRVASAYRLRKAGETWPHRGADFFYLDDGLLEFPHDDADRERVEVTLAGLNIRFVVKTQTVAEPEKHTLLKGLWLMLAVAAAAHVGDAPIPAKYSLRTVGGLKGEELIMRSAAEHKILFSWLYVGESFSEHHPKIEFEMEAQTQGDSEKKARQIWDALLDSMRPTADAR